MIAPTLISDCSGEYDLSWAEESLGQLNVRERKDVR